MENLPHIPKSGFFLAPREEFYSRVRDLGATIEVQHFDVPAVLGKGPWGKGKHWICQWDSSWFITRQIEVLQNGIKQIEEENKEGNQEENKENKKIEKGGRNQENQ